MIELIEENTVEFKSKYIDDIKYTVIAFANSEGGDLYIGINDDGSVCGVENVDATMLSLTNMIRDTICPDVTMFTKCYVTKIDNKDVVVLNVQRGTARPYYLCSKGVRPAGVFVRQGASSVSASESAILQMIKETCGDRYEDARSLNQKLTFNQTSSIFAQYNVPFEEAQKRTLNIIGSDGTYTNLGLLLSDQCPHTIKIAIFQNNDQSIFSDRKEISGSLLQQVQDAHSFINSFNKKQAFIGNDKLRRFEQTDYPYEALREALLNAIVHREYALSASTIISLYSNRIEFINIGGLAGGLSKEDILTGISFLRNPKLANVFYRLMFIEAYGTGIIKINNLYAKHPIKPSIEITPNVFKLTLPNVNYCPKSIETVITNYSTQMETLSLNEKDRIQKVLALLKYKDSIVRKEVDDLLGVSQSTSSILLRKMLDNGLLVQKGSGRKLKYCLPEEAKAQLKKDE